MNVNFKLLKNELRKKMQIYATQKIKTLGGIEIDEKHQIKILEKLGFVIKSNKNNISQ